MEHRRRRCWPPDSLLVARRANASIAGSDARRRDGPKGDAVSIGRRADYAVPSKLTRLSRDSSVNRKTINYMQNTEAFPTISKATLCAGCLSAYYRGDWATRFSQPCFTRYGAQRWSRKPHRPAPFYYYTLHRTRLRTQYTESA